MHGFDLILTLTAGLGAALAFGYLTERLGLSPLVGYLLAGTLVGPHTPGFVADSALADQLAEIGVILLMFGVGLQFHIGELLAVRRIAVPGAIAQSTIATGLGAAVARAFGWGWFASIVFGIALAVASTVVLVRVLADNRDLHTPSGHIAVGWLVVEDLLTVVVLVLLPALATENASASNILIALAVTTLKVAALVGITIYIGNRAIPWLLNRIADTRSRELFTLTVLVVALGLAVGSAIAFGVSMALGAFLAGMVVGRSDFSLRAASEALPMRDAFAVLFFVSVGMLLDPRYLMQAPGLILATLAVVMIGKPLVAFVMVLLLKHPVRVALSVAVALAQIGEFSFLLSALGKQLGILDSAAINTIVAVAIISIVLNPLLYRAVPGVDRSIANHRRLSGWLNPARAQSAAAEGPPVDPAHRAVIIGYGPTGRTVTRLLRDNGIEPAVIELNMTTVRELRDQGMLAVYGDASHRDTLSAIGIDRAASLVISAAGLEQSAEVIRAARELNPSIFVLARVAYLRDLRELGEAGADMVFSGEGEVALAFTEAILHRLGATPEQIDRERARVHEELHRPGPA